MLRHLSVPLTKPTPLPTPRATGVAFAITIFIAAPFALAQDSQPTPTGETCSPWEPVDVARHLEGGEDWRDCIVGCAHTDNSIEIEAEAMGFQYVLSGTIDGETHAYPGADEPLGPDIDVIPIFLPARAVAEFWVVPHADSPLDPVITTHDGTRLMTFNDNGAFGELWAHSLVAGPYITRLPIFLLVTDETNYMNLGNGGPFEGGPDYGYDIYMRTISFEPIDLGSLGGSGESATVEGEIFCGGEMQYFRFDAPADSQPIITLTRSDSAAFVPALIGHKTIQNQMVWHGGAWDDNSDGVALLDGNGHRVCDACGADVNEFVVGVFDYNGAAAREGRFTYTLEVRLP